ncbi:MAG: UMP kinase [Armatimonadota bacterium]|nr:UMP kinase [Armatimonadota bacterium]
MANYPAPGATPRWKRILLKLSGEAFAGDRGYGLDPLVVQRIAREVKEVIERGVQVAIVVGGGNIFRGAQASGIERATADYMGMIATVLNALSLQDALEKADVRTRVQTAIEMRSVAEPYVRRRALRHLEKGRVVIFGAGTGNPFFTTDTAAALRAQEMQSEVLMKATNVDGVYDSDPHINANAERFNQLTHHEVMVRNLKVMDLAAISLTMESRMPILVFDLNIPGNIVRAVFNDPHVGTLVSSQE